MISLDGHGPCQSQTTGKETGPQRRTQNFCFQPGGEGTLILWASLSWSYPSKRTESPDNCCRACPPQSGWPGAQKGWVNQPQTTIKHFVLLPSQFMVLTGFVCFPFCPNSTPAFNISAKYVFLSQCWGAKSKEESYVHLCIPDTFVVVMVMVP